MPQSAVVSSSITQSIPAEADASKLECIWNKVQSSVQITFEGKRYACDLRTAPWLFSIVFNPSHKLAQTFSDLTVLRAHGKDIQIASIQKATIVQIPEKK